MLISLSFTPAFTTLETIFHCFFSAPGTGRQMTPISPELIDSTYNAVIGSAVLSTEETTQQELFDFLKYTSVHGPVKPAGVDGPQWEDKETCWGSLSAFWD